MFVIAGLGNPGQNYDKTRHNVGFMVADALADIVATTVRDRKHQARIGQGFHNGKKIVLLKPQTYMNLSGESVAACLKYLRLQPENLIVVHDDMDLPLGKVRVKTGGGAGGHKGVISIIERLGTPDFARVRVGIGKPERGPDETVDYVLSPFSKTETEAIAEAVIRAAQAVLAIIDSGVTRAMNDFNGAPPAAKEKKD